LSKLKDIVKAVRPGNVSNVRVILLCVFGATTFWFFNALNENYSTTLNYPLNFIYDTDNYVAVESPPENVQINVTGLGWNLFRNSLGIKVTPLDIRLEEPAETKKIVSASVPGLINDQLDELQLNYVLTDTLFVNIDHKISKKFLLIIDSANISLEDNFRIVSPLQYSPDSVELQGPSRIIRNLPDTILVGIPQEEIDENYDEDVSINLPNGRLIRRNPPTVSVQFEAKEFVQRGVMAQVKIENISDRAYIEVEEIKATFLVPESEVDEVDKNDFVALVNFNEINEKDSTINPRLDSSPDYATEVRIDTARIKVSFNE